MSDETPSTPQERIARSLMLLEHAHGLITLARGMLFASPRSAEWSRIADQWEGHYQQLLTEDRAWLRENREQTESPEAFSEPRG